MAEFTGERVIPGQVDSDLWNEHVSRYHFAARLCRNKRVLDLACGTGYGAAEMSGFAAHVTGVDQSAEAIAHALANFATPTVEFLQASVTAVPLPAGSFDLITAFEVIEHLANWRDLLNEARRLLAPGGQFIVSTPNKDYYAESRKLAGPNPFHAHEFVFEEFQTALQDVFQHVSFFVQNHSSAIIFQPLRQTSSAELKLVSTLPDTATSNFYVAVCALSHQTGSPAFLYIPTTANVLREREQHIWNLERELSQKDAWLQKAHSEHASLVQLHENQKQQLEARNHWAQQLNEELAEAAGRVLQLQHEIQDEKAAALETVTGYEAKIAELESENLLKTQWAQETELRLTAELEARGRELAACVDLLQQSEKMVEERTLWAERLKAERRQLEVKLSMVQASRWHKLGRRIGLRPEVTER